MPETLVVAGSLAQRPFHGGHTWVFLQYLLGFRRLGYEVLFVDQLGEGMCVDAKGRPAPFESSANLTYLADVMQRFGLGERWTVLGSDPGQAAGRPRRDVVEVASRSALLLNVMGFLEDEEILAAAPVRAFLDIDPGFGQIWHQQGLAEPFRGHDHYVTIGERIGEPSCSVPTCGIDWVTTKQPVALPEWPVAVGPGRALTSVASWRGPFGPLEFGGRTLGLRVHEFRRFLELPELTGADFEVALDIDDAESEDLSRLDIHGWTRVDPREVAGDPWRYRDYVRSSLAELMIAKNLYVQTRSGWFSDRSACYLASGRPVIAQDTGLEGLLPTGEGLLTFASPEEAVAAVEELEREPARHRAAARAIAEEHFDSDRVLASLLERLGVR